MEFLNNIHWRRGQPIDIKERNIIINLCGAGLSNSAIALALSRDVRTVNKWYQRWYNTGEVNVIKQRGRPRATTSEEDLNISLHAIQKPSITSNEIKTEAQIDCCRMTVGRRLRESKLFCRAARIKEHLSAGHKARRMLFAENNLNFAFWDRTIIVDESTFMTGHKTRTLVRRPIATAYEEKYIVQSAHSGRKSLPVFGLMHAEAIGPLVCIEGTFDSEKYIDILDDIVLPYIEEHFPDGHFYYYQDNSPIHRARTVREWFERNIPVHQLFETPPKSPDIPPIENLWGLAKVRVSSDGIYADEEELWLAICEAWNDMRELTNYSRNLVNSIPQRLQAIIDANGGHTRY